MSNPLNRPRVRPTRNPLNRRFSFFAWKGHLIEMVNYSPYPWRALIDGEIRGSFAGSLTQAKRAAKDLIAERLTAQKLRETKNVTPAK
jgi:hypothetical protein